MTDILVIKKLNRMLSRVDAKLDQLLKGGVLQHQHVYAISDDGSKSFLACNLACGGVAQISRHSQLGDLGFGEQRNRKPA